MARTRKPSGRGTRFTSGKISGVSGGYFVENPSAVMQIVSGVSYWAGTTVTLVTGLNTISSLLCSVIADGAVSQAFTVKTMNINNNAGCASALLQFSLGTGGGTMPLIGQSPGCSIAFIAFGT